MITSTLLRIKKTFTKANGEIILDLISSTFEFKRQGAALGPVLVKSEETMRPDLLADRIYGNQERWDLLLKFNGISNPFSLEADEILLAPSDNMLSVLTVPPKTVPEKGSEAAKSNEQVLVKAKTKKDQKRLDSLKNKIAEITPPNINLTGESNIQVVNGRVIFGGNMTAGGGTNSNQSLTRARVAEQLKNSNSF